MTPTSRLLLFEDLLPNPGTPHRRAMAASDLHLFLLWGGGHRTLEKMDELLQAAELERVGLKDLSERGGGWVVEARRDGR
jgi:hypothetical protein